MVGDAEMETFSKTNIKAMLNMNYSLDLGPASQGYGFPVVMYGCESWTVKKAEREELMLLNCGVGEDS